MHIRAPVIEDKNTRTESYSLNSFTLGVYGVGCGALKRVEDVYLFAFFVTVFSFRNLLIFLGAILF